MTTLGTVAFDECGYTGEHLLDSDQAVFTLASVLLDERTAKDLLARFEGCVQGEFKYVKLKKATRNQPLILSLLQDGTLDSATCKIFAIHKPFMLVTKLVDNIYEPLAHEYGLDLYEGRAALATANLIVTTFPVLLGRTRYFRFLKTFSDLCRRRDPITFAKFEKECESIYEHLNQKFPFATETFAPVLYAGRRGLDFIKSCIGEYEHDPIIPSYHVLANEWSKQVLDRFNVLADESKVLASERDRLLRFSDPSIKDVVLQQYTLTSVYPLKIANIITARSDDHSLIQLADILSGASFHALNSRARSLPESDFEQKLFETISEKQLFCGSMWPSNAVTPEALDAVGPYSGNLAEYTMRILGGDPAIRKA